MDRDEATRNPTVTEREVPTRPIRPSGPVPCRRFGVLDAMILVAVTAGWLAAMQYLEPRIKTTHAIRSVWHVGWGLINLIYILGHQISLLLLILSFAVLVIRFRPPRPTRRQLWRQPGLAACAAAILGVMIKVLSEVVSNHVTLIPWDRFDIRVFWGSWTSPGIAVAGAWLALAFTSRWRSEPSGIDRLGRVIGACWLIEVLVAELPGNRWVTILSNLLSKVIG